MKFDHFRTLFCIPMLFILSLSAPKQPMASFPPEEVVLTIHLGKYEILDFDEPVKRVAIADPEIADATVTSSSQVILNGKTPGMTSLIVWTETESYTHYRLEVQSPPVLNQVMLRVRFLEVNKSALKELGSDFIVKNVKTGTVSMNTGFFGGKVSEPADPLILGNTVDMFFSIPQKNISAILKAMKENNLLQILASPNLSAASGSEASFLAGGEFPIPIVSGSMGMQTVTIHFKEFGVRLHFLPRVLSSDIVNINVKAEVSNLDFENGVTLSGFRVPSLVTRKAETTVELTQGQHLVIGGLLSTEMAETISRIPILGHIPVLGLLFSSRRFLDKESELLITLSPEIVQSISEEEIPVLDLMKDEKRKKSDEEEEGKEEIEWGTPTEEEKENLYEDSHSR